MKARIDGKEHHAVTTTLQHISGGLYGMILIEPEGGLIRIDKEICVMLGEIYADERSYPY